MASSEPARSHPRTSGGDAAGVLRVDTRSVGGDSPRCTQTHRENAMKYATAVALRWFHEWLVSINSSGTATTDTAVASASPDHHPPISSTTARIDIVSVAVLSPRTIGRRSAQPEEHHVDNSTATVRAAARTSRRFTRSPAHSRQPTTTARRHRRLDQLVGPQACPRPTPVHERGPYFLVVDGWRHMSSSERTEGSTQARRDESGESRAFHRWTAPPQASPRGSSRRFAGRDIRRGRRTPA